MVSPGECYKCGEEMVETLCISKHVNTQEEVVVFKRIVDGKVYHLPVNDFLYKDATDKTPNYEKLY